jgi:hypothetical protein
MPKPGDIEPGPNGRRAQWNGERWVEIAPMPTAPATPGPRPGGSLIERQIGSGTYNTRAANNMADFDTKMIQDARNAVVQGSSTAQRARQISQILRETYTGPGSYIVQGAKALVGAPEDLTNLATIKRLGEEGIFGDLDKLKGAISDKDVQFLRGQQVKPGGFSGLENKRIVDLMNWTNKRAKEYENAMNAWTNRLGSPSRTNARGQSFQSWWNDWADQNIPRPDLSKPRQGSSLGRVISVRPVSE